MHNSAHAHDSALSVHARYTFSFSEDSRIGRLYPTAYQGIGIAAYSFFDHELIGTPMVIYIMQGARIASFSPSLSLGYEWNVGFSWGWHPNDAMHSRYNAMINVGLPLTWRVKRNWELSLTPDYTHFSNGDTAFPNGGANMFGLRMGVTYLFNEEPTTVSAKRYILPSDEYRGKSFGKHMTYDIMFYGSWRADRFMDNGHFFVVNEAFPIVGLRFQPLYHLNRHFSLGPSLDIQADSSLNLYNGIMDEQDNTVSYSRPPLWQQMEIGISLHGEIRAPIFAVGVGIGLNMLDSGYDASLFYTTFSLKAFISRNIFLHIGYRFNSTQYTHNIMYGLGVRF